MNLQGLMRCQFANKLKSLYKEDVRELHSSFYILFVFYYPLKKFFTDRIIFFAFNALQKNNKKM